MPILNNSIKLNFMILLFYKREHPSLNSRPVPKRWRGVPRLPGSQEPGLKSARSRTGVTLESGKSGDPTTRLRIRPEKNFELGKSVLFVHFIIGRSVPKRWRGGPWLPGSQEPRREIPEVSSWGYS